MLLRRRRWHSVPESARPRLESFGSPSYTREAMPIYEYRRPDGTTFEVVQRMTEDALTHDPETGVPVQRVLSAPAVHFKGSGFYNTDYGTRKRQRETASAAEKSADAKSAEKKSETKTESAPAKADSSSSPKRDSKAAAA